MNTKILLPVISVLVASTLGVNGQLLYLDPSTSPVNWNSSVWSSSDAGPYTSAWANGNTAVVRAPANIGLTSSVSVAGLSITNDGANGDRLISSATAGTSIGLSGVVSVANANKALVFGVTGNATVNKLGVTGSFEKTGVGSLVFSTNSYDGSSGTVGAVTATGGAVSFRDLDYTSATTTDLIMNGGTVNFTATSGATFNIRNLSGASGLITANAAGSSGLRVNSTLDTTYGGNFTGSTSPTVNLSLSKNGAASLTLTGTLSGINVTTRVEQGLLIINSSNATFGDTTATSAIEVKSGGYLGGNGTIATTAGDNIVVENGGGLSPGALNATGNLTLALGSGASLDLSSMNTNNRLLFTLGTNSDRITLSSGSLNIGTLNSSEFSFSLGSGFGIGEYLLFDTGASITGLLDTSSFSLGAYSASLSLINGGQDIALTVIPEPSTASIFCVSLAGFVLLFWNRRRLSRA